MKKRKGNAGADSIKDFWEEVRTSLFIMMLEMDTQLQAAIYEDPSDSTSVQLSWCAQL